MSINCSLKINRNGEENYSAQMCNSSPHQNSSPSAQQNPQHIKSVDPPQLKPVPRPSTYTWAKISQKQSKKIPNQKTNQARSATKSTHHAWSATNPHCAFRLSHTTSQPILKLTLKLMMTHPPKDRKAWTLIKMNSRTARIQLMTRELCYRCKMIMLMPKSINFELSTTISSPRSPPTNPDPSNTNPHPTIHSQPETSIFSITGISEQPVTNKKSYPPSRTFTKSSKLPNLLSFTTPKLIWTILAHPIL